MMMKSFLFAIVAVLLSLNVWGQTLRVYGDPFASSSICNGCSTDNNGNRLSRIVVTCDLPVAKLGVKGAIVVSIKDDDNFGIKTIEFIPNQGQKFLFFAAQCQPLEVTIPESVSRGAEYMMHITYANNSSFESDDESTSDNNASSVDRHEYIDLGLPSGTLWATCNIGANAPEEFGDYFAWGETETKSDYYWSNYKFGNGEYDELSKYDDISYYDNDDFPNSRPTLERSDDVAYQKWGSDWCMPTMEQLKELKDKCTWTWTARNGNNGYEVRGSNGNSIFLPATGCNDSGVGLTDVGSAGFYWSSTLFSESPNYVYDLFFDSDGINALDRGYRYYGTTVRAVRSSK